jgi:hypothetical protein
MRKQANRGTWVATPEATSPLQDRKSTAQCGASSFGTPIWAWGFAPDVAHILVAIMKSGLSAAPCILHGTHGKLFQFANNSGIFGLVIYKSL